MRLLAELATVETRKRPQIATLHGGQKRVFSRRPKDSRASPSAVNALAGPLLGGGGSAGFYEDEHNAKSRNYTRICLHL